MPAITDFYQDVYAITDREDLVSETAVALRRALRHCHYNSEYYFDVQVQSVAASGDVINNVALPERYRATVYLGDDDLVICKEMTPQAYFRTDVLMDKTNVFWIMGSTLNIRARSPYTFLQHYYLQVPDFLDSRIAIDHKDFLVFKAAEYVFSMLKDLSQANKFAGYAEECAVELQRSIFLK